MALFGGMGRSGLFGVKQPWDEQPMGGIPGIPSQIPHRVGGGSVPLGGTPKPEGKGGVFGSGMSGEDIINLLMRASALANGDYGSASQITQLMQSPMIEKAKREAERDDYVWKKGVDREYDTPDLPPIIRDADAWARMTPQQRQAYTEYQDVANPVIREGKDGLPYAHPRTTDAPPPIGEDEWNNGRPIGGATVNPPRTFPPRLRR